MVSKGGKWTLATVLVLLTSFFAWHLQFLQFDFEFEKFFPKNHPETELYAEHVAQFGYDNDYLQVVIRNKVSIFDSIFLRKVESFEKDLKSVRDVASIYSPLSLKHAIKSPTGFILFPLIHLDEPDKFKSDSSRIFGNEFYKAAFSDDAKSINLYLSHEHISDQQRGNLLLADIYSLAAKHDLNDVMLIGKLSATGVFIQYMQDDFGTFLLGSIVVSFVLLLIIFREIRSAFLPFIISVLTLVWLFGLIAFLDIKINLLSSLLPPILFFVSMSDAIHLMNAIKKEKSRNRLEQLTGAIKVVWVPTLLTSITTAIGFLSLLLVNTQPIQVMGICAAIGVLIALIITFTAGMLFSSFINYNKNPLQIDLPGNFHTFILRHRKQILISVIFAIILLIPGIFQLRVNSFLLDDLPKDSKVRQAFEYSDAFLGGSKPFEVRLEVADTLTSIWDKPIMDEILKIDQYLRTEYPVARSQSPASIMKYFHMVQNGGLNQNFMYPASDREYRRTITLKNRIDPRRMDKLLTEDGKTARIIGFIPELGSYETMLRNEKLRAFMDSTIQQDQLKYRITGTTYLIDKSHELLSANLLKGLFVAIIIIALVLGLYFKSWKLLVISLVPNLIPLLLVAGTLGWLGISLKMTTSIIFTIAFGIAVDDTIHMMSNYLQNKSKDTSVRMKETFHHAGSAMVLTSVTMIAGFALFLFSSFGATFYLGLFICLSLFIALMIDLFLLPILLTTFIKNAK
ncbi:MAG: efflux RND transporter permease subunit [Bacteroidota bacterium]